MNKKSVVVGYGEVGKALTAVLDDVYLVDICDPVIGEVSPLSLNLKYLPVEVLHICFPYSDSFVQDVKKYQEDFKPKHTVIHSTVPLGTSRQVNATHSPVRGLHPNLEGGIRCFVKFLGGEEASQVADYFRRAGIKVCLFDKQETTEALKLFDTTYYGVCIDFAKRVKEYCDKHDLNFSEVYTIPNQTYNEGYSQLGYPEFTRPVLQPIMKPTGGHCVEPNKELLNKSE